jgi:outer membrane protein OmpA-like peptidoglycan-associated protein
MRRRLARDVRDADLFWNALVGGRTLRAAAAVAPSPLEDVAEWAPEAVSAGLTASPVDISRTSETLDAFALDSATLTATHRTTIGTIAASLLALRGGSRPVRNVEVVGFTDPTGGPTHNRTLGERRARAVRDALVAELNRRTAGSAASFTFRVRSLGETQQVAGGPAANRRVEVFVDIAISNVAVHASDRDTHEIRSNLGAAGLEHFCCVKGTGDIVLEAEISPNIPGAAGTRLTWDATGTAITSPAVGTDARTCKLSSAASGKFPIAIKWDGTVVRNAVAWVIWSRISVTATRPASTPAVGGFDGILITAGIDHSFTIEPAAIITDADRPALDGARTAAVPGAAQTHLVSGNTLAGGAGAPVASSHKWDASRQIRMKVLNPRHYTVAQLPVVAGHLWNGQPADETIPEDYPANDALGNDDTSDQDPENNDPYANGGVVTGHDDPQMPMPNSTGADGDTFEMRFQFREFLRVNLDTTWYRASDFSLWRFHPRFRKNAGAWTNNSSTFAQDNAGF